MYLSVLVLVVLFIVVVLKMSERRSRRPLCPDLYSQIIKFPGLLRCVTVGGEATA